MDKQPCNSHDVEVRKGPWTMEEDLILMNYIANHGGGVWNSIARAAGLKRTGKSCRLRWLNYLRPDVRRGNITPEEQLVIMELHAKWGNRWAKIAKHLPGRTDNEIKNYWRTRVQKHIKQGESCSTTTSTVHEQIIGSEQNDQANTVPIMSGAATDQQQQPQHHHHHHHHLEVETYSSPPSCPDQDQDLENFPPPNFPNESTDNFWSMEDFWSMQLFNAN